MKQGEYATSNTVQSDGRGPRQLAPVPPVKDSMDPIQRAAALLEACGEEASIMPPTELYNEGWLLRLILDWFSLNRSGKNSVCFAPKAIWYSEALLPSRFLRGANKEGYTHADAVIGELEIKKPRGDVRLAVGANQFVVVEAKMGSSLAKGVKYAPTFNQAARNVACMLHMLTTSEQEESVADLAFLVFAPAQRIGEGYFSVALEKPGIKQAIRSRDEESAEHKVWCDKHLDNVVDRMRIEVVSWEALLTEISSKNADDGAELFQFYTRCCKYNGLRPPTPA
jgi:hypothetical protein